jgi:preprotein translocase subunit SecG
MAAHAKEREDVIWVLVALDAILGLAVLLLVFLHSGKDAGLSGILGGGSGALGGSGVVQKNLDRLTIGCSAGFFIISIALAFLV